MKPSTPNAALPITGDTFDIRDRLKDLGCKWDAEVGLWYAADEGTRAMAQALADAEPARKWREFMDTLAWAKGAFTDTAFQAGLNACSRGIPIRQAIAEIRERIEAAGGKPEHGWCERNVGRAYDYAEPPKAAAGGRGRLARETAATEDESPAVAKPVFDPAKLKAFASRAGVIDAGWLADRSPIDPGGVKPVEFLSALYKPGERVVVLDVFRSQGQWLFSFQHGMEPSCMDYQTWQGRDPHHAAAPPMQTGRAFDASGPQGIWYLCNPVDGAFRVTEDKDKWERPKWSRRFELCVTDWRYFVFESDEADPRDWVGAIVQLPLRIAAIYTSGGKSIHVLVRVDAKSKVQFDMWRESAKRTMIPLGADKQCMSAVRLTRLPGCQRLADKDGVLYERPHLQKLLYLNPEPDARPLVDRAAVRNSFAPWERWALAMLSDQPEEVDSGDVDALLRGLRAYRSVRAKDLCEEILKWKGNA